MNNNNQLGFVDILSIMSFVIGLMNLDENLTQNDKQELQEDLSRQAHLLLDEIHNHLRSQDDKLDKILELLGERENNDS